MKKQYSYSLMEQNKELFNDKMYSSEQWFTTLDSLISSGIDMLLQSTTFVQEHVSLLINYQHVHKKRGVSVQHRWEETISHCCMFLRTNNIESYNDIKLDRGISIQILKEFLDNTIGYVDLIANNFRGGLPFLTDLSFYHNKVGATCSNLYGVIQHIDYIVKAIAELKYNLLSYYVLYIEKTANYDSKNSKFLTDSEEIKQNYYLAFNKAVDHFNLSKGAFKSYLDIWITKYRNYHTNYYGTAYIVPSGSGIHSMSCQLDDNIANSEHCETTSCIDSVNEQYEIDNFRRLALIVDPEGYTINLLGLNEQFI